MHSRESALFVTVELLKRAELSDAQIAKVVELAQAERSAEQAERDAAKREKTRARNQRYRQRQRSVTLEQRHETHETRHERHETLEMRHERHASVDKPQQNAVTLDERHAESSEVKNLRKKEREEGELEDSQPSAEVKEEPRPPAGEYDWESSDGTIFIPAAKIYGWINQYPSWNIRGQIRDARRTYLAGPITSEQFMRRFEKGMRTKDEKRRARQAAKPEARTAAMTALEAEHADRQRAEAVRARINAEHEARRKLNDG